MPAVPDTFRLRYRVDGKRYSVTFKGSRAEAKTKLRELLRSGDTGQHVAPDRLSVKDWVGHWIETGAPGSSQKRAGRRTVERYSQLLRVHVLPKLGAKRLQALKPTDIDDLYSGFDGKIAPRTAHHVHTVLGACLGTAVRKGLIGCKPYRSRGENPLAR